MKAISLIIIFSLLYSTAFGFQGQKENLLTIDALKKRYPTAIIKEVSIDEYRVITQNLRKTGRNHYYLQKHHLLANTEDTRADATSDAGVDASSDAAIGTLNDTDIDALNDRAVDRIQYDQDLREPLPYQPRTTPRIGLRVNNSIWNSGDKDGAVIIYVVLAIAAVVVLVFYAGKYLYDVLKNKDKNYRYWFETSFMSAGLLSSVEEGHLIGLKLATGFIDENTHVGLAADLGYLNVKFNLAEDEETIVFKGNFFLLGPTIRWHLGKNSHSTYYFIDLLAGTTEHKEVGMMSIARTGFNFSIGSGLRYGFSFGSMFLNLKASEGLIRNDNDFNMISSLEMGYQF